MSSWSRWRSLPPADRRFLVEAGVALARARLLLPFVAIRVDEGPGPEPAPGMREAARSLACLVGIAAAHAPFRVTCLHRSLALRRLLRRRGIPCALRLGVRTSDRAFEAHAWVEFAGVPLHEDQTHVAQFRPLAGPLASAAARGRARYAHPAR